MNSAKLSDWMQIIGIFAVVASLIFVGLQMRQEQRISFAEQQGALIGDQVATDALITASADLIIKLNTKAELDAAEEIAAQRLLNSLWASAFFGYQRWFYLDHPALEAPARNFAFILYENPGLRTVWVERRTKVGRYLDAVDERGGRRHSDRFADLVNDMLTNLDSAGS